MNRVHDLALFHGCNRRQRAMIDRLGTTVVLTKNRRLSTQGEIGRQFAVIVEGEATVFLDGQQVATLHAGDCVGEVASLTQGQVPATATVEASTGTTVWALTKAEFNDLIDHAPTVASNLTYIGLKRAATNATAKSSSVRFNSPPTMQPA